MPTQKYQIHISKFCARVYRQHEDKCGPPPAASETMTNGGAGNFNDESAEAAWSKRWGTQTPISHVDSIPPDDDVYEGFDQKARPMDALPAYLAERSGISYQDAVEYIWRARFGCQWSGLNLLSGEVRRDVTAIAKTVSAYFSGAAMDELLGWFTDLYPQEASEMGLALPTSAEASDAAPIGDPPGEPESKQLPWSDDAPEFLPNKDVVALSKGKMSESRLSRLCTPTGPIRYMRKRNRCKVHIGEFRAHLGTIAGGLSENEASDIAAEFLSSRIEERKAAERRKRASRG